MIARERQEAILTEVRRRGVVRVTDLATSLSVSDMTIRRDITQMAEKGMLERVHGGAALTREPSTNEPRFEAKSLRQFDEKAGIAARAAQLVSPGLAIGLSGGTTTRALALELADVANLTVVTNSLPVAEAFYQADRPDHTVLLTGGTRTPSAALVGPIAITAVRSLHLDIVFLGSHGLDLQAGLTTPNLLEAEINRALIASARKVVVLCDHTKLDVLGISSFASLEEIDVLVTDDGLSREDAHALRDRVGQLIVVPNAQIRPQEDTPDEAR